MFSAFLDEMILNAHFVIGVLGAILGAFILAVGEWTWQRVQEHKGWMTGKWTQSIPMFAGRSPREDLVVCRHRGERVWARISRVTPEEDAPKNWVFDGALRQDGSLVGFFLGLEDNSDSYGVIFLRKEDRNKFTGHYMKLLNQRDVQNPATPTDVVKRPLIPLVWKRIDEGSIGRRLCSYIKSVTLLRLSKRNIGRRVGVRKRG